MVSYKKKQRVFKMGTQSKVHNNKNSLTNNNDIIKITSINVNGLQNKTKRDKILNVLRTTQDQIFSYKKQTQTQTLKKF